MSIAAFPASLPSASSRSSSSRRAAPQHTATRWCCRSIGNSIIAENQRRLFDRLMQQNLGFFGERHSSEFLARLVDRRQRRDAGAQPAGHRGRPRSAFADRPRHGDGAAGSGDVAVRACDRAAGVVDHPQTRSPDSHRGESAIHRRHPAVRDAGRKPSRASVSSRPSRSKTRCATRHYANVAVVENEANKMARVANRSSPLMEMLGGIAIAMRRDLWRLSHHRDGRDAGRILLLHHRLPAGL